MIDKCTENLGQYDLFVVSKTIMFIFTPNQTLVATPLQLFMIKHSHGNYRKRLKDLRGVVESGEIRSMSDLIEYNGLRAGNNVSQFDGLEMIRMDLAWVK